MQTIFSIRAILIGVTLTTGFATSSPVSATESLETQYQRVANETLDTLRKSDGKSVGVLKFAVRIGEGSFAPNVGRLNLRLAEQLELALVMANPARQSLAHQQIGVVRSATDFANTIKGATHATQSGRSLLFSKPYPLAWEIEGKTAAVPDAFIVGVAQVHNDLRNMDVELQLLLRNNLELKKLASFTVKTDFDDLVDGGESFTTRGLFDDGKVTDNEKATELVAKKSVEIRQATTRLHPLATSNNSPVRFEVFYNNALQPIEFRDGSAFLKEPQAGQKVSFAIRRNGTDKSRYGVLIQVNGENTLYRERNSNARSSVWILEPSASEFGVFGFQIEKGVRQDFRVLSQPESEQRAIDYGRDVGLISVVVFQENKTQKRVLSEDELDLAVQSKASLPSKTAVSRGQLGKTLFDQLMAQDSTRGLIAEGEKTNAAVTTVPFDRDPIPVMATSIRYYKAQ